MAEMGGIDTSMYATPAHKSVAERGNEFVGLMNNVTQNTLLRTSIQAEQLGIAIKQLDTVRRDFASLNAKKNPTRADAQKIVKMAHDLNIIDSHTAAVWENDIPDTEDGIREWATDQGARAMDMSTLASHLYQTITSDQGGQVVTQGRNQFTGETYGEPVVAQKGLTPSEQMQRVETVGPDGVTQGTIPISGAPGTPNDLLNPPMPGNPAPAGVISNDLTGPSSHAPIATPETDTPAPAGVIAEPESDFLQTEAAPGDKEAIAAYTEAKQQQGDYTARVTPLEKAIKLIEEGDANLTGPGAETLNEIRSTLLTNEKMIEDFVGADLFDPDELQVAKFDELRKYMNQYSLAVARDMGATEGQLLATGGASPGTHISQMANEQVLKTNLALERMQRARVLEFQRLVETGEADERDWNDFSADWGNGRDVRAYALDLMSKEEAAKMVKGMKPKEAAKFWDTYEQAIANDIIDEENVGTR